MLGPMRSILYVPGTRQDRFLKALASGADAVVFDLEDGVAADQKGKARAFVADFFAAASATPPTPALRLLRFNQVHTPEGDRDLEFFVGREGFDAVVLPKVETAAVIEHVAQVFHTR